MPRLQRAPEPIRLRAMPQRFAREDHRVHEKRGGALRAQIPLTKHKAAASTGYGPCLRAIASEPRRSFAIRALPLPDSILLAGKSGGFARLFPWASCSVPYPFELFTACPVTDKTPTGQRVGNRSIAFLLSNVKRSICCSKLAPRNLQISSFISIT
jgi:hypothetical protein